jgi:hypothetical protein
MGITGSKTEGNWMLMGKTNGIEGGFVLIDLCGEAQDTACVSHDVARPLARLFGCSSLSAACQLKVASKWTKEDQSKPLPFGGESSIAVLLELVARVSVDPKLCSQNGVANLK